MSISPPQFSVAESCMRGSLFNAVLEHDDLLKTYFTR